MAFVPHCCLKPATVTYVGSRSIKAGLTAPCRPEGGEAVLDVVADGKRALGFRV
ncbi:hypothetical protein ACWDBD_45540 [Streptomyces sp. NPDC001118]